MRAKETTGTGLHVPGTPLSLGQAGTLVTEVMCFLHLKAPPSMLKEALPLSEATRCKSFPEHPITWKCSPGTGQLCNMRSEKCHNCPSILLLFGDLHPPRWDFLPGWTVVPLVHLLHVLHGARSPALASSDAHEVAFAPWHHLSGMSSYESGGSIPSSLPSASSPHFSPSMLSPAVGFIYSLPPGPCTHCWFPQLPGVSGLCVPMPPGHSI